MKPKGFSRPTGAAMALACMVGFAGLANLFCLVCLMACGKDPSPVAGGTSSETVIGRVVLPDGGPAAGAAYRLRAERYLRNPADPRSAKISASRAPALAGGRDGVLDADGRYRIDSLEPGEYRLEIRSGIGLGLLLPVVVKGGAGPIDMGRGSLAPVGHLAGTVIPANADLRDSTFRRGYAQLFGVERTVSLNEPDGGMALMSLAAGRYGVRVFSPFPFPQSAELPGVEIRPGETTSVGEIRLNRILGSSFTSLVPDGLVAYWPFDEGGGSIGVDPVGGNDARFRGSPSWTPGIRDQALLLDGVDDYGTIPALYLDGDFSVAAWVRLEGRIENNQMLVSLTDSTNMNFAYRRFRLYKGEMNPAWDRTLYPDDPPWDVVAAKTVTLPSVWTHVAVTREAGGLKVYMDGRLDGTGNWTGTLPINEIGRGPLNTGAPVAPGNLGHFQGALDELRIYSRALTPEEAASLAAGKPGP